MVDRLDVRWEGELAAPPEVVWEAFTANASAYLWPVAYEPREGGAERGLSRGGGTVTVWEPPVRFRTVAGEADGHNQLDYELEARGDRTFLRYHHQAEWRGDDFAVQNDSCIQHTAFYNHSLGEYVGHFAGRAATYVTVDAPASSADGGSATLRRALGVRDDVAVGDRVHLGARGIDAIEGVVDYATPAFVGVRTDDALFRIYGRDTWAWPVSVAFHLFADVDADALQRSWQRFLDDLFATEVVQ
jgi:hypothetical protein